MYAPEAPANAVVRTRPSSKDGIIPPCKKRGILVGRWMVGIKYIGGLRPNVFIFIRARSGIRGISQKSM